MQVINDTFCVIRYKLFDKQNSNPLKDTFAFEIVIKDSYITCLKSVFLTNEKAIVCQAHIFQFQNSLQPLHHIIYHGLCVGYSM